MCFMRRVTLPKGFTVHPQRLGAQQARQLGAELGHESSGGSRARGWKLLPPRLRRVPELPFAEMNIVFVIFSCWFLKGIGVQPGKMDPPSG